jgi:hypothetical protein
VTNKQQQLKRYNYEKKQSISFAGCDVGIGNGICAYIHVGGIADGEGVCKKLRLAK